jgi:hypothetical protein
MKRQVKTDGYNYWVIGYTFGQSVNSGKGQIGIVV